jgi:hypothetical protein
MPLDRLARTYQQCSSRVTFCKPQHLQEPVGEDFSGNQLHRASLNSTPHQASLSEEQAHSQQSSSSNAVSRPQPQLSRPSQRRQPTSITSRPLHPQPTGIPPPHREHRLKLRITRAVYLQNVSIKAHTIHNRALIVRIPSPQFVPRDPSTDHTY